MIFMGYMIWSFASALIGGLVSIALNKWASSWSLARRVLIAVAAATLPTLGIVAFYFAALGPISLWFSPDEFLIPFALQVFMIVVVSAPIAWLISRRAPKPVSTDVFD